MMEKLKPDYWEKLYVPVEALPEPQDWEDRRECTDYLYSLVKSSTEYVSAYEKTKSAGKFRTGDYKDFRDFTDLYNHLSDEIWRKAKTDRHPLWMRTVQEEFPNGKPVPDDLIEKLKEGYLLGIKKAEERREDPSCWEKNHAASTWMDINPKDKENAFGKEYTPEVIEFASRQRFTNEISRYQRYISLINTVSDKYEWRYYCSPESHWSSLFGRAGVCLVEKSMGTEIGCIELACN